MAAEDERSFKKFSNHQQDNYQLPIWMMQEVLSDEKLVVLIPNYVNGRPTKINTKLIMAAIWLSHRNFMEMAEMHELLMSYDNTCKSLNQPKIPLQESLVQETLMTVGRALPTSMFIMWCKKCWQFLECAEINKASGAKSKSVAKVKGAVKDSSKGKSA